MNNDSPIKAILVVVVVALVCSSLVSAAVVMLRPIQLNNQLLDRSRNIMQLTGLLPADAEVHDDEMLALFKSLDARIVDIDEAAFDDRLDPYIFDQRRAANNPELSAAIPVQFDHSGLGRRSRYAPAFLVWQDDEFERIILPIHGNGMWSTLYGYIALGSDLNTIDGAVFYEQNETPGLGDQVTRPDWLAQWQGRQIYDEKGDIRFKVSGGRVDPESSSAAFEVDVLTGATVTADAVTGLVQYWFGPHGFQPFLESLREERTDRPIHGEGS
ncbi:Na(+)-translocating NADH-quinone reductase subunit C [Pseudomonadota bacterium]